MPRSPRTELTSATSARSSNGTLKPSPTPSHTDGLIEVSSRVLQGVGARVDTIRVVDHTIPPGVHPDMRKQGWDVDDFPDLYRELIEPADIVVLATPVWLGDQSSMTRLVIERLYGRSGDLNGPASGPTTARSGVSWSLETRTGASTAPPRCCTPSPTSSSVGGFVRPRWSEVTLR